MRDLIKLRKLARTLLPIATSTGAWAPDQLELYEQLGALLEPQLLKILARLPTIVAVGWFCSMTQGYHSQLLFLEERDGSMLALGWSDNAQRRSVSLRSRRFSASIRESLAWLRQQPVSSLSVYPEGRGEEFFACDRDGGVLVFSTNLVRAFRGAPYEDLPIEFLEMLDRRRARRQRRREREGN